MKDEKCIQQIRRRKYTGNYELSSLVKILRFYNLTVWNLLTYFMQKPNVLLYARLRVKQFINARIKRITMGQSSSNQQTEKLP